MRVECSYSLAPALVHIGTRYSETLSLRHETGASHRNMLLAESTNFQSQIERPVGSANASETFNFREVPVISKSLLLLLAFSRCLCFGV